MKTLKKMGAVSFAYFVIASTAMAQQAGASWDVSAVVTEINSTRAIIIAVGMAIFGILGLILGYRMVRKIIG